MRSDWLCMQIIVKRFQWILTVIQRRSTGMSVTSHRVYAPPHRQRFYRCLIVQWTPEKSTLAIRVSGIGLLVAMLSVLAGCSRTHRTAQPTSNTGSSVSRIDVSRVANERVANPQELCDRIPEIKMF